MFGFTAKHVYARQDDLKRPLPINEYLNFRIDTLAKDITLSQIYSGGLILPEDTILGLGTIKYSGQLVSSRVQHSLYSSILYSALVEEYSE